MFSGIWPIWPLTPPHLFLTYLGVSDPLARPQFHNVRVACLQNEVCERVQRVKIFQVATGQSQPDLPFRAGPPPNPFPSFPGRGLDPILTCFAPDSDPQSLFSGQNLRSEKLQNESSPNFSNFRPEFCPEFCSEFSPNFSRSFCALFRGGTETRKNSPKIPVFFQCQIPRQTRKKYSQNVSGGLAK